MDIEESLVKVVSRDLSKKGIKAGFDTLKRNRLDIVDIITIQKQAFITCKQDTMIQQYVGL